jgi:hypothetical protein
LQAQRAKIILGQFTAQIALGLVAELGDPFVDHGLIKGSVPIHGGWLCPNNGVKMTARVAGSVLSIKRFFWIRIFNKLDRLPARAHTQGCGLALGISQPDGGGS